MYLKSAFIVINEFGIGQNIRPRSCSIVEGYVFFTFVLIRVLELSVYVSTIMDILVRSQSKTLP